MTRESKPDAGQARLFFAIVLPLFSVILAGTVYRRTGGLFPTLVVAGLLGLLVISGLVWPAWGLRFYRRVRACLEPVAQIVSLLLLGLVYFGVVTPIAVMLRISGRDRLGLKPKTVRASEWHEVQRDRPLASYFRQF
jgi:RsiW-degrading membrane proteinase PrsW (M82 family)